MCRTRSYCLTVLSWCIRRPGADGDSFSAGPSAEGQTFLQRATCGIGIWTRSRTIWTPLCTHARCCAGLALVELPHFPRPCRCLTSRSACWYHSRCWLPAANNCDALEDICMWDSSQYCWLVICKNDRFHQHGNRIFGHRILLGETDAVTPLPALKGPITVRCDECGKQYSYEPAEVLRFEQELPESFTPHPLFR